MTIPFPSGGQETMGTVVTLKYSPAIVASAARRFFQRFFGAGGILAFVVLWAMCGILLANGERGWLVVALTTFTSTSTFIVVVVYALSHLRAVKSLSRFDPPEVVFEFDERGFKSTSSMGESSIRWSAIQKLWRFPEVWLLFVSNQQYFTLPIEQIPIDLQTEIEANVRASGGKVK